MRAIDGALAAARGFRLAESDPLAHFRARCDGQRDLVRYAAQGIETHAYTGNGGGKTTVGAALGVALCRGLRSLDGIALPGLRQGEPWTHWVLVKSRPQQVDAAQAAYRRMIGTHPAKEAFVRRDLDYLELIRVRPDGWQSDDPSTWSKIVFHCEGEGGRIPGGRVDSIHADEPPPQTVWTEARARWREGGQLILYITETPIRRSQWWWIFRTEAGFIGCQGRPRRGRVAVQWHVSEVHGEAAVRALRERYAGDAYLEARLSGDPVDDSHASPFGPEGIAVLNRWADAAVPGDHPAWCPEVEVWSEHQPNAQALMPMDPSSGVRSPDGSDFARNDPCGLWIVERRHPRPILAARFVGYKTAFQLGAMGREVGGRYGNARAIPEMNGGYGEALILGLKPYTNLYLEEHHDRLSGQQAARIGWRTTSVSRGTIVSALQRAVLEDAIEVRSLEAIEALMDLTVKDGKVIAPEGLEHHGEDMIGLGIAAHLLETEVAPRARPKPPMMSPADAFYADMGMRRPREGGRRGPRWR